MDALSRRHHFDVDQNINTRDIAFTLDNDLSTGIEGIEEFLW
jgi:hypothetical protein